MDERQERAHDVLTLRQIGRSYAEIGRALGLTRCAVAGIIRRDILQGEVNTAKRARRLGGRPKMWTEARLTEPWAVYSARLRRERELRP